MTTALAQDAPRPSDPDSPLAERMESFSYDDRIVRMFVVATIFWGVVAMVVGLVVATLLVLPSLGWGWPRISFGRLRPLHTNVALFAFAGNGIFAAVYYSTQRLCKARMWSDVLSQLHFWGWQAIILAAAITLPLGMTQAREYAELEWPIDIAIAVVWVLVFGTNFLLTLVHRRERHMYVALWFYIATIVTVGLLHVFNNLVVPAGWLNGYALYAGVQDAFMQWWYGHNMLAFFLTMPFLGLMYYFLPKAAGRPVYSYRLSIIHFWSLVILYILAGPHQLHYTAMPQWATTLGLLFGIMLWMPSWGGLLNGLLTLRGAGHKVARDPVLKFFVVGLLFYGLTTFEAVLFSTRDFNALTQYTDWTIAHLHAGALGWNGFMIFGMVYWMLPRLFQTKLWSERLMNGHFWVGTLGILLYIVPIYIAGIRQGLMWHEIDETGRLAHPEFLRTVESNIPMWWLRIAGGAVYLAGAVMLGVNLLMTWMARPSVYDQQVQTASSLSKDYTDPLPASTSSRLDEAPVLELAKRSDIWSRLDWHRRWERLPVKFTVLVTAVVVIGTLLEAVPLFLIRSNVPAIAAAKPYTPLELAGRHIYLSEGCYNCHSQMVRSLVPETMRYGDYSKPGEFIYDSPALWGSRRIGPDLAREGGRRGSGWHWRHLDSPETESPGSVMPSYRHLLENDLNYDAITPHVQAAADLGVPYSETELQETAALARRQAEAVAADIVQQGGPPLTFEKQAVALIAYLQRLGVDATEGEAPAEEAAAATADQSQDADAPDGAAATDAEEDL